MTLKGKKLPQQKNPKDRIKELETALQNVEMAARISQMMLKQLLDQVQGARRDIDNTMGVVNDLQYRTLAILDVANLDKAALDKAAEDFKLKDYTRASDQEDLAKGYELDNDGVITDKSVVIITSSTNGDEDRGIFRSKFPMSECKIDTLREKLLGSRVGDSVEETVNGELHKITVLGIRKVKENEKINE